MEYGHGWHGALNGFNNGYDGDIEQYYYGSSGDGYLAMVLEKHGGKNQIDIDELIDKEYKNNFPEINTAVVETPLAK